MIRQPTANARDILGSENIEYVGSAMEAAKDADALLVLTDWDEFRTLDLTALRAALRYPIVIDGRNLFSPDDHGRARICLHQCGTGRCVA